MSWGCGDLIKAVYFFPKLAVCLSNECMPDWDLELRGFHTLNAVFCSMKKEKKIFKCSCVLAKPAFLNFSLFEILFSSDVWEKYMAQNGSDVFGKGSFTMSAVKYCLDSHFQWPLLCMNKEQSSLEPHYRIAAVLQNNNFANKLAVFFELMCKCLAAGQIVEFIKMKAPIYHRTIVIQQFWNVRTNMTE